MKLRSGKQAPPSTGGDSSSHLHSSSMIVTKGLLLTSPEISSKVSRGRKRTSNDSTKDDVVSAVKLSEFKQFDIVSDNPSDHNYRKITKPQPSNKLHKDIMKEWRILETNLPESIFVRVYEGNMNLLRAVIIGPSGTPYHDGLFFFDLYFPQDYPKVPPQVYYHSHGLRLNPNLYANGIVCLSLLNTWYGKTQERWNPNKSTILQVLVSIQGLVLNSEPLYNEPFFSGFKRTPFFKSGAKDYNDKAFLLSCKTMVYLLKNPPKNFEGFVVDHFLDRAKNILGACKAYINGEVAVGRYGMHGEGGSKSSCSSKNDFKKSLAEVVSQLIEGLTKIGVHPQDIDDIGVAKLNMNDSDGLGIVERIKKKVKLGFMHVFGRAK